MELLYFCVISLRGNFHRKLHASPYEPSRPEAMDETIVCCGEGNSDSLSLSLRARVVTN